MGNSPIPKKRLNVDNEMWVEQEIQKILTNLRNSLGVESPIDDIGNGFNEMIDQLKEKYHDPLTTYEMKIKLLTILPKSWSISRIAGTMNASFHAAKSAKDVLDKKGVLGAPNKKEGNKSRQLHLIWVRDQCVIAKKLNHGPYRIFLKILSSGL